MSARDIAVHARYVASRAIQELDELQSPLETYNQQRKELIANLDVAFADYKDALSSNDDPALAKAALDRHASYSKQLYKIREPGLHENELYEQKQEAVIQRMIQQLAEVMGPGRSTMVLQRVGSEQQTKLHDKQNPGDPSETLPDPCNNNLSMEDSLFVDQGSDVPIDQSSTSVSLNRLL